MSRHDLTNEEWNAIRVFLPAEKNGKPGRPWVSHRQVINGILWILSVGGAWRDLPPEYGRWKTVYNRFRRWRRGQLWDRIMNRLLHNLDSNGIIDRSLWCVDGTVIRAHRCAAGALKESRNNSNNNALGRSRGGFGTKLHFLTDAKGIPLAVTATPGESHESKEFINLMSQVKLSIHRKQKRPKALAGDKGYVSQTIRQWLKQKKISDVIPTRSNQEEIPGFNKELYRQRNIIERSIGWLKEYRRIATRYDKIVESYLAFVKIAMIRRLLKYI